MILGVNYSVNKYSQYYISADLHIYIRDFVQNYVECNIYNALRINTATIKRVSQSNALHILYELKINIK